MMRRRASGIAAALASLMLLVFALYACVLSVTFDASRYPTEGAQGEAAAEVLCYLRGDAPTLSERFSQDERLHMVDVRRLFALFSALSVACLLGALALGGVSLWLGGARALGRGMVWGVAAFAALVGALGLWAALDFTGWFYRFHELLFTNDLWLLPADSVLIGLMPTSFFMRAVRDAALRFIPCAALTAFAGIWLQKRPLRRRRKQT